MCLFLLGNLVDLYFEVLRCHIYFHVRYINVIILEKCENM